ncbi:aldehyde dehydrogenase family protein [Rhodococcus sp. IEGM 1366]|uniref:aldehyde dehydrogenase family protein n=1 Tax=Rhodococcus sp. IEGM 1366 TaxID=3082223 RepID=UPI002953ECBD|nr:aldehyde dehydrogenase family protein [Rhodococcus sp. IEGM 1366]MDV8070912.1 aldehyde dehydrogenase family protein [Rhodococcus sp. IEGM 1366]
MSSPEATLDPQLPEVLTAVIGGQWTVASPDATIRPVYDPATEQMVAQFAETPMGVVDTAVENAHAAWHGWANMAPLERGRILTRLAEAIRRNVETLATLESADTGKPISQARGDIAVTARYLEYYGGACDKFGGTTLPQAADTFAYTVREPYGVVAHITPWNAPISQMMRGVAPCLAAGNTVVVKPSELTPITTSLVAILMVEAGLPAGVCNIVLGDGPTVGAALVGHELVRHIAFTGSVAAGQSVGRVAADRIVGCHLELGGKSPTIVCSDANLERAAHAGALAVIRNSGQSCFATTRLFVHRSVHDEFVERVAIKMQGLTVGRGADDPDLGPLVSAVQRDRVLAMIEQATSDGAQVIVGGQPPADRDTGFFVMPTLIASVTNDMAVAQQEVFGPVQSVIAFDDVDDAILQANDTPYGLSAGVFTSDISRAHRIAHQLQAGQVQINRYAGAGVEVPFGGYKASGIGREKGIEALLGYTQLKSVIVALD